MALVRRERIEERRELRWKPDKRRTKKSKPGRNSTSAWPSGTAYKGEGLESGSDSLSPLQTPTTNRRRHERRCPKKILTHQRRPGLRTRPLSISAATMASRTWLSARPRRWSCTPTSTPWSSSRTAPGRLRARLGVSSSALASVSRGRAGGRREAGGRRARHAVRGGDDGPFALPVSVWWSVSRPPPRGAEHGQRRVRAAAGR